MRDTGPVVGIVGLGNLGLPVARRLLKFTEVVYGFDVRAERVRMGQEAGLLVTGTVGELAEASDVVLLLTSDAAQAAEVIGPAGVAAAATPPRVVVLMATTGPGPIDDLAALLPPGTGLIDCPVSGGAAAALDGELSLLVGGQQEHLSVCGDLLDRLGTVHVLGGLGAGQSAKLANQIVFFGAQAALQEATSLAAAHGVDQEALLRALQSGTADCWAVRHFGFFEETARAYDKDQVPPSHRPWHKDLATAREAARQSSVESPLIDLLSEMFGDRVDHSVRHSIDEQDPPVTAPGPD